MSTIAPRPGDEDRSRLTLFDGFRLETSGLPHDVPVTSQRLLAYLAVHGEVNRSVAAGTLWPEGSEERALASLRTAVWRLRRDGGDGLVVPRQGRVGLSPSVWVDTHALGTLARDVLNHDEQLDPADLHALGGWHGDLLPGWDEEWVFFQRERYRQLRMHLFEALSGQLLSRGRFAAALEAGLDAVECEPLRESGPCAVIAVHLAEGNVAEARRHYDGFARLAASELGVVPSQRMRRLVDTAAAIDPGDDSTAVPGA